MNEIPRPLGEPLAELVARRFRVLGHPVRIGLIDRLDRLGDQHVQALADELAATQQNTSKHLATLWRTGLVTRRQEGRVMVYSLADQELFPLIERVAMGIAAPLRDPTKGTADIPDDV